MTARELSAELADHVAELGYQITMAELGRGDTAAALAEIDVLAGKLSRLRERLDGQAAPVVKHRRDQAEVPDECGYPYVGDASTCTGCRPRTTVDGLTAIDEQPADQQARELAELLAVLWRLCDEGQLPAELDSLLLGEYFHLRPARADRPDMLGDVRALADQVDW